MVHAAATPPFREKVAHQQPMKQYHVDYDQHDKRHEEGEEPERGHLGVVRWKAVEKHDGAADQAKDNVRHNIDNVV